MEENKEFRHPEGKIQLIDGRILDCYPLEQPRDEVDNQLSLDTTGQYLTLKKSKANIKVEIDDEEKALEKIFLENAFVFLENREKIMSDSRMFLCPVPSHSGVAYFGTGGFRNPTLGVFVEWWINCPRAIQVDPDGEKWLVYHLAGSPLSGINSCRLVNLQGETKSECMSSFGMLWHPFVQINRRYNEAKSLYEAYTLREVLTNIEREENNGLFRKNIHIFSLEQEIKQLKMEIRKQEQNSEDIYARYRNHLFNEKRSELEAFFVEYKTKREDVKNRIAMIDAQRMELRRQMREGVIDHLQYQRLWTPIHKEKDNIQLALMMYEHETLRKIIPDIMASVHDVEEYLKEKDNG